MLVDENIEAAIGQYNLAFQYMIRRKLLMRKLKENPSLSSSAIAVIKEECKKYYDLASANGGITAEDHYTLMNW